MKTIIQRLLILAFGLLATAHAQVAATDSFDPAFSAAPVCMAQQPDGKVLFGGNFTTLTSGAVSRTSLARVNADGSADAAFNANITAGNVQSIAVQPDGKILVVGGITIGGVQRAITRLNADSSVDSTFAATSLNSTSTLLRILLQPDGKVLVWSASSSVGVYADGTPIARLNADGSRDASFNITLGVQPDVGNTVTIATLVLQQDGKIVYGYSFLSNLDYKVIGRLNANGTTDTAFNNNVPSALLNNRVGGIALQRDGRIVLTSSHDLTASSGRNNINRLNADGTLDTTFAGATLISGTGGMPLGNTNGLSPQADGKLVVFGNIISGTYNGMTRLNADGSLDSAFAPTFLTSVPAATPLYGGLIQADGKVIGIGAGFATVNGTARFRVARLTNDAATQTLTADSASAVTWTRGGSAPDAYAVTFENSTDSGATWTRLSGTPTRVSGTGNWQLTGLALPATGQLRATGLYGISRVGNTAGGGSTSATQQVASYTLVVARPTATIVSLTRQNGTPRNAPDATWQVVFSQAVGGLGLTGANFAVVQGGSVTGATVASASPTSGPPSTTWNISADTGTGNGTLGLNFVNDTGMTHQITTSLPFVGEVYTIVKPQPTVVTTTANSGAGSLRQAVLNANANPGADTITFDPTVFATAQTIVLELFLPRFAGDTTVTGPAAGVTVRDQNAIGMFSIGAGTTVSITSLTMSSDLECISNYGTFTASDCGFTSSGISGIGIKNSLIATVTSCRFIGIGAIANYLPATLTVRDSSFTGSIHNEGAATMSGCTTDNSMNPDAPTLSNQIGATLTLTNCSLLDGSSTGVSILNDGTLTFQNCTVVETEVSFNAATFNDGTLTLKNTIFRKSPASGTAINGNPFIDGGGNFILSRTAFGAPALAADLTTLGLDPTGLQNNGGPTKTVKLLGGAAINGGLAANVPGGVTTDQRGSGFARSVGTVDIGAYEHPRPVQLVATTASAAEGTGSGSTDFTFTVTRPGATTDALTVNWAITGTGTNPANAADFSGTLPSGTLTLPIGTASDTIIIRVVKDATVETDETFTLTLSNPTAAHAIAGNGAVATIVNDDVPPTNNAPTNITLSNATIAENNTPGATIGTLTATDADAGDTHTFTFVNTANSNLAAHISGNDNAAFTLTGNVLSINGSADFETKSSYNIRIRATDNGSPTLSFEKSFTISITDVTIPQTIAFAGPSDKAFGDADFMVSATGGASGQPVTFTASGAATATGNTVHITRTGHASITASQAGSGDYAAAVDVVQRFYVYPGTQVITFAPAATALPTATVTLTATGGASGNAVTFSVVSGPGSLAGNVLTFTGNGAVVVRASQEAGGNYDAAADVERTITVGEVSGPPAVDDAVTLANGSSVLYPLANDGNPNANIASVSDASVVIDGRTLIVPAGFTGTFTYTNDEGQTATVTVTTAAPDLAPQRFSGLLYNSSTGAIVGRARTSRTVAGINVFTAQIGSATGKSVFTFPASGNSATGISTALGTVSATLATDGHLLVTMSGGVSGDLRPSVLSASPALYNVGLGALVPAVKGAGFGTARINSNGSGKVLVKMPDGRAFSASTELCDNGSINFYGRQASTVPFGYVGGELIFANLAKTDLTGELEWKRPAQSMGVDRAAVNSIVVANGCVSDGTLGFPDGPATLTFTGGNYATPWSYAVTVSGGAVTPFLPTLRFWTPVQTSQTFKVRFRQPSSPVDSTGTGMYFQKSQTALGYFPGLLLSGKVELKQQ